MIKEWNLLRVVACLTIVLLHSTTQTGWKHGFPDIDYYHTIRAILCYATPTFVVLSEIILANKYPNGLPKGFWLKRFKYIYLPFISFAIIDALATYYQNPKTDLLTKLKDNIIEGDFGGYFVLIIIQFYILHLIVTKFKFSMLWFVPLSIMVMEISLNVLRLEIPFVEENEHRLTISFTTWIAYFAIAFLIGKHYTVVAEKLRVYKWHTILMVIASILYMFVMTKTGLEGVTSRRVDLLPLVISMCLMVLAWGQYIPNSKIVNTISNYSFGIYLLHWQIQRFIAPYTANYFNHTSTRVLGLFFISLILSMILIKLISYLPFGSFIVGRTTRKWDKKFKKKKQEIPSTETADVKMHA